MSFIFRTGPEPWFTNKHVTINTFKYHVSYTDGKIAVTIIYFNYLFFHRRPTHKLCFLSCRPFVVNATFLTGRFSCLLAWAVGSWSLNHWLFQLMIFEISFVAWSGLLIFEFKSQMRGEVCILSDFVLRWHHWAGIWRRHGSVCNAFFIGLMYF